jgi:carboxymethylenebutenolidase
MRKILAVLAALVLVGQTMAAEIKTRDITFKSGADDVKGYLAVPEGKGPFPAIVVIQEWWGLTDWIKENARHFAKEGYVALAPDLYRGKATNDPAVARKLMQGLPPDRALGDLKAAVDALAKMDNVDKAKIGSIGWCMGGGYSLGLARKDKRVMACVICYGRVETDPDALKTLNAKVLGIFGKEDKGIPIDSVRKFGKAMKKADKKVASLNEYDAGHGFMRPGKNPAYQAREAKRAWEAIDKFFAQELKGKE